MSDATLRLEVLLAATSEAGGKQIKGLSTSHRATDRQAYRGLRAARGASACRVCMSWCGTMLRSVT